MILNDKILKRIYKQERGWVFCSKDFLDYGSRNNIDKMLSILAFNKEILRIERGIYYYPKLDDKGTPLPPSMIMIAKAVANNFGLKIFPSGQKALKMLGFPISEVEEGLFWTNGKTIKKKVGQIQLDFKHKKIIPFSKTPEAVITVLCAIMQTGKENIDELLLSRCAKYLTKEEKPFLFQMSSRVPIWVAEVITKILENDEKPKS